MQGTYREVHHMSVSRPLAVLASLTLLPLGLALGSPAVADPETVPGGPWPGQENTSAIRSYDQLWRTLETIDGRAKGRFDLEPAPLTSNTGREIPVVTVGDGPTSLMLIANTATSTSSARRWWRSSAR
jgi:hypothetical protein